MTFRIFTQKTVLPWMGHLRLIQQGQPPRRLSENFISPPDEVDVKYFFVAFDKDFPVAYAGLQQFRGHWCMMTCIVMPTHRGMGLQVKLLRERIKFLQSIGKDHVNAWVRLENTPSVKNLLKVGFEFSREKPRRYMRRLHHKMTCVI